MAKEGREDKTCSGVMKEWDNGKVKKCNAHCSGNNTSQIIWIGKVADLNLAKEGHG